MLSRRLNQNLLRRVVRRADLVVDVSLEGSERCFPFLPEKARAEQQDSMVVCWRCGGRCDLLAVGPFGDGAHFQPTSSAIELAMPIRKPLSYGSNPLTSATRVV